MNIIGISAPISANPAAAVIARGRFVSVVEEERFVRVKHAPRMLPLHAIEHCLRVADLRPLDVDVVAVGYRAPASFWLRSAGRNLLEGLPRRAIRDAAAFVEYELGMRRLREWMRSRGFHDDVRIRFVPHHIAHAASAYRCSGANEAAVLTIDGQGEDDSGMIALARDGRIRPLARIGHLQSLGWFYGEITKLLGFTPHLDEGKVMGLSGWGSRRLDTTGLWSASGESYRLRRGWVGEFARRHGPPRARGAPLEDRHRDIAFTAQRFLEDAGEALARKAARLTGSDTISLAGGVALNCDMNMRIWETGLFRAMYVQPAAHDAGTAIGAAMEVAADEGAPADFHMDHAYWGPEHTDRDISDALASSRLVHERTQDAPGAAAEALAAGKVVAWYQGRAEVGPRALGGRSILAHPGRVGMRDHINLRVKHREPWRPLAPSVLHEDGSGLFERYTRAPFMNLAFRASSRGLKELAEAVHVDGTSRIQTVERGTSPRYHALLERFRDLTGIPGVINTSFNDTEPMVLTPKDAIRCFAATGIDVLVMGDHVVRKEATL